MWLLVVEDEADLQDALQSGLEEEGHTVDTACDGIEAEELALTNDYDILIVDVGLPGQDGFSLVKNLRRNKVQSPVIMLTARAELDSRIRGLDAGADDYLTKPFSFEELFARLRALSRRLPEIGAYTEITVGVLNIDTHRRTVSVDQKEIFLRPKEFAVLELLARRSGTVVTRTSLAERIWGSSFTVSEDVINMTVSSLRRKLNEDPHVEASVIIQTRRGIGYRLIAR